MSYQAKVISFIALLLTLAHTARADIQRDPIGVNVSAARPMSLTVRFADSNGALFTSDQALFCYRQLPNGQCDPATILGSLPRSRDLGSTNVPTSRITDVMTIPYSVIRSTLSIAQEVDFSDFFYVRRFIPAPGVDLGAGVDQVVYQKVTCHFAGPARVPLSLTKVSVFGRETFRDDPVRAIRLNQDNLGDGQIYAHVEHTGTGFIEGWWEIRHPGEAEIREVDRLPQAALAPAERGLQNRYFRLKRFRAHATTAGLVVIEGPRYDELPRKISGRHDILLRFPAGRGRENRARLSGTDEPLNVFSGVVAGFQIPVLEYHVPVELGSQASSLAIRGRLLKPGGTENPVWKLAWQVPERDDLVVRLRIDEETKAIAPVATGVLVFPADWLDESDESLVRLDFVDSAGVLVHSENVVAVE